MDDKRKIWLSVFFAGFLIAVSLWLMMYEFDHHGLSFLAVLLGLFVVAVLQIWTLYVYDTFRRLPQDVQDNFFKLR